MDITDFPVDDVRRLAGIKSKCNHFVTGSDPSPLSGFYGTWQTASAAE